MVYLNSGIWFCFSVSEICVPRYNLKDFTGVFPQQNWLERFSDVCKVENTSKGIEDSSENVATSANYSLIHGPHNIENEAGQLSNTYLIVEAVILQFQ